MCVSCGANHRGTIACTNIVGSGYVVAVVVGQQDHIQTSAGGVDRGRDRTWIRRIHDRGRAGFAAAQQPSIVIGKYGNSRCNDHRQTLHQDGGGAQILNRRSLVVIVCRYGD